MSALTRCLFCVSMLGLGCSDDGDDAGAGKKDAAAGGGTSGTGAKAGTGGGGTGGTTLDGSSSGGSAAGSGGGAGIGTGGSGGTAGGSTVTPCKANGAPPALDNPIVVDDIVAADFDSGSPLQHLALPRPSKDPYIDVDRGYVEQYFPYDRDVLIKLPSTVLKSRVTIRGGRHVRMIGGHLEADPGGPTNSTQVMVSLEDIGTSVFIEGLSIDVNLNFYDAIVVRTYAQKSPWDVTLQNVWIEDVAGEYSQNHGDVFQNQMATIGKLTVENLVASTGYQGFFIPSGNGQNPQNVIAEASFRNIHMKNATCTPASNCPTNAIFFYLREGTDSAPASYSPAIVASFDEVYVDDSPKWTGLWGQVYPNPNASWGAIPSTDNKSITFPPEMKTTGEIRLAPPPCEFVKKSEVGLAYVSPHP